MAQRESAALSSAFHRGTLRLDEAGATAVGHSRLDLSLLFGVAHHLAIRSSNTVFHAADAALTRLSMVRAERPGQAAAPIVGLLRGRALGCRDRLQVFRQSASCSRDRSPLA